MNIEGLVNKFSETLGGNFPGLLVTLLILVIGVFLAKLLRRIFVGAFKKTNLNKKIMDSGVGINAAEAGGMLIYFVVMLNVLLIVLERMNITTVLDPLKNLASQLLGAIPNLIGAGIVLYAGLLIAKIVKNLVEIVAVRVDELIEKSNLGINVKVSKPLGIFVFALIFLPMAIQAVDMVSFDVISVPAKELLSQSLDLIVKLVIATLVISVTYYVAKKLLDLVSKILLSLSVNDLPQKVGLDSALPKSLTLVNVIVKVAMFFIMLTAIATAVDILEVELLSEVFTQILNFGGKLLVGAVILVIGGALANIVHSKLSLAPDGKFLAGVARFAILGLVLSMGLKEMGLAENIVNMAFGLTLGAVAVAFAIAFGVGGIEAGKTLSSHWANKIKK